MSDPFDPERPDVPLVGLYRGYVTDRDDPKKLGRVRVRVPGLLEPESAWAWPLGFPGAGARRGMFFIPETGDEVGILFEQGDVDSPHYLCGHWRKPPEGSEVPEVARDAGPDVRVIETPSYLVVIDERPGSRSLQIRDKSGKTAIEMDGLRHSLSLTALSSIDISCDGIVRINGLVVQINDVPAGSGQL